MIFLLLIRLNKFFLSLDYDRKNSKVSRSDYIDSIDETSFNDSVLLFKETLSTISEVFRNLFLSSSLLTSKELLGFFHSHYSRNYTSSLDMPPPDVLFIDHYLSDETVYNDRYLQVGDSYFLPLSVLQYPDVSQYNMLTRVLRLPYVFRVFSQFQFLSEQKAKVYIDRAIRNYSSKLRGGSGLLGAVGSLGGGGRVDTAVAAEIEDADIAKSDTARGQFGFFKHVIILRGDSIDDLREPADAIISLYNRFGYIMQVDSINNFFAFTGSFAGNIDHNKRRAAVKVGNFLHFYPLSGFWRGFDHCDFMEKHTGVRAPHVIGKVYNSNELFGFTLFRGDVGHSLVIGQTGSGKSVLLSTLAIQFFRYGNRGKHPRVVFFDVGGSSRRTCANCDGLYFDVGVADSLRLNVFERFSDFEMNTGEHRDGSAYVSYCTFLTDLLFDVLKSKGLSVNTTHWQTLYNAFWGMNQIPHRDWNTFSGQIQDPFLRDVIAPFCTSGSYSDLFTDEHVEIASNDFLVFEMKSILERPPEIAKFVLFYIFRLLEERLDGTPTLLILDEAWLMLSDPVFSARIKDWLKTMRKYQCAVILATQSLSDLNESPVLFSLLGECMTRIFTANTSAGDATISQLYSNLGLSDDVVSMIADMIPKKHYLFSSPVGTQCFDLGLTKEMLDIIVHVPSDSNG